MVALLFDYVLDKKAQTVERLLCLVHNWTIRRQMLWQAGTSPFVACPRTWDAVVIRSRPRSSVESGFRALTIRAADRGERPRVIPDECRSPVTEAKTNKPAAALRCV